MILLSHGFLFGFAASDIAIPTGTLTNVKSGHELYSYLPGIFFTNVGQQAHFRVPALQTRTHGPGAEAHHAQNAPMTRYPGQTL